MMSEERKLVWSEEFTQKVLDVCRPHITSWCCMMETLGLTEEDIQQYKAVYLENVESLLQDMNTEVKEMQNMVIDEIENLLKTSAKLCKQLDIKMPDYGKDNLGLYKERDILKKKVAEYKKIYETRQQEIRRLESQERALCACLGRPPKGLQLDPLPNPKVIAVFESYLEELERIKFERTETFCTKKSEIVNMVQELGVVPFLEFEKSVIETKDAEFLLTDENMELLNSFYLSLKKQLAQRKEEADCMREKIRELWHVLEIKETGDFWNKCSGNLVDDLKVLKEELKRCENLKRENMQVYIEKRRKELASLWDDVHFTEQQRSEFQFFNTSVYTEDLLEIHERELQKVKEYYEEHREIYALLQEHKELWKKKVDLDTNDQQPNRYKNRGGQLLKEEKQRNKLNKRIPLLEQRLLELADVYYQNNGEHFLTWGITIQEYIDQLHEAEKEERLARLSAKKQRREQTLTPGKSTLLPSTSSARTPTAASKRKNVTPLPQTDKKLKLALFNRGVKTEPCRLAFKPPHKVRTSLERMKRLKTARRKLNETNSIEYSAFEQNLENLQPNSRSTMFVQEEELAKPLTPKKSKPRMKLTTPGGKVREMRL